MAKLTGSIVDGSTGQRAEARVQVLTSSGRFAHPPDAILKVGPGAPFFYSDGTFEVDVTRGVTQVIVERGTEYAPAKLILDAPAQGVLATEIALERWSDLADRGWHPGNTHIHYDEKETRPDERLRLDPRIEDLRMTAVSVLRRWDLEYATNRYPVGMLTEFSSAHHYVQCGEENRHNAQPWSPGYGHVMLLGIHNVVDPVSRGVLVDAFDPDYPPLCYACDDARRQGGIVNWNDVEYDIYYQMLNAGLKLPASTGSDWFISSANRVYAHTRGAFDYQSWVQVLKGGRTFITNGPALFLSVEGRELGAEIEASPGDNLSALVRWQSHYPINRAELIFNGNLVARQIFEQGSTEGHLEGDIAVPADGWVAARLSSDARDSFFQPVFAHTSPIYVKTGLVSQEKRNAARLVHRRHRGLTGVGPRQGEVLHRRPAPGGG